MSSRDIILNRLRKGAQPFTDVAPITERKVVASIVDTSPQALRERFVSEAQKLKATVWQPETSAEARDQILELIGADEQVLAWDFSEIPLDGLGDALEQATIRVADHRDGRVRVGITGVHAALAATGSIVVKSTEKTSRLVSLLPYVHIAIIKQEQILPHLEAWLAQEQEHGLASFRDTSMINVISGPSRTADIGMELVLGAHGPATLHLILLD